MIKNYGIIKKRYHIGKNDEVFSLTKPESNLFDVRINKYYQDLKCIPIKPIY